MNVSRKVILKMFWVINEECSHLTLKFQVFFRRICFAYLHTFYSRCINNLLVDQLPEITALFIKMLLFLEIILTFHFCPFTLFHTCSNAIIFYWACQNSVNKIHEQFCDKLNYFCVSFKINKQSACSILFNRSAQASSSSENCYTWRIVALEIHCLVNNSFITPKIGLLYQNFNLNCNNCNKLLKLSTTCSYDCIMTKKITILLSLHQFSIKTTQKH